jgi:hypothetical protein
MISTSESAIATYIVAIPAIPAFAVVLTLGILGSYLVERAKCRRSTENGKATQGAKSRSAAHLSNQSIVNFGVENSRG